MAHLKKVPNGHLAKIPSEPPPEPSTDCSNCAPDCDGGAMTLTVSGFTGICAFMNGVFVLTRVAECTWQFFATVIICTVTDEWNIDHLDSFCNPCALICIVGSDHPIGFGEMVGRDDCSGQTGSFTLT